MYLKNDVSDEDIAGSIVTTVKLRWRTLVNIDSDAIFLILADLWFSPLWRFHDEYRRNKIWS